MGVRNNRDLPLLRRRTIPQEEAVVVEDRILAVAVDGTRTREEAAPILAAAVGATVVRDIR